MGILKYFAEGDHNRKILKAAVGLVRSISEDNIPEGVTLIYDKRNKLYSLQIDQVEYVIKSFKVPIFVQRIVYTFIRPSKAIRSFRNSLRLYQLHIDNPQPIGAAIEYSGGLLSKSYYLSEKLDDTEDIRSLMDGSLHDPELLKMVVHFIVTLHLKGVLHIDLSPGNILKSNCVRGHFFLVDLNRMKFFDSPLNEEMSYQNLARISDSYEVTNLLAEYYAIERGFDPQHAIKRIQKYSDAFFSRKAFSFARRQLKKEGLKNVRFFIYKYRLTRCLRKLLGSQSLYQAERNLYFRYIKCGDIRGAILRTESYE